MEEDRKDYSLGAEEKIIRGLETFWQERKGQLILGALFLYLGLLALGALGTVLHVNWIMNLFVFSSPG